MQYFSFHILAIVIHSYLTRRIIFSSFYRLSSLTSIEGRKTKQKGMWTTILRYKKFIYILLKIMLRPEQLNSEDNQFNSNHELNELN
jgi:hypothetical protein